MNIEDHINKMRLIQQNLLGYINGNKYNCQSSATKDDPKELFKFFDDMNICADEQEIVETLRLILQISNYHHHEDNFYNKIDLILSYFKEYIKSQFTNFGIYNFFKSNKRVLLYLVKEKILVFDQQISNVIEYKFKNQHDFNENEDPTLYYYFYPELKSLINYKNYQLPEDSIDIFEQKRKDGENDNIICQLIRADKIEDFKKNIKQNKINISSSIEPSIYETNSFLLICDDISLIQYAAFCGSIQIFKYLCKKINIDSDIINFAICSNNEELVQFIKDNVEITYWTLDLKYLIMLHQNNLLKLFNVEEIDDRIMTSVLKSFNYEYITLEALNEMNFIDFCKYGFPSFVKMCLDNEYIDINSKQYDSDEGCVTPISMAIFKGNSEIVKILLENEKFDIDL